MIKKLAAFGLAGTMLAGCAGGVITNQAAGTVLGGVGGAVIGSQIGSGSGQVIATVAGGLIGAFIGNQIGASLDAQAQQQAYAAQLAALNSGQTTNWNAGGGKQGTITVQPIYTVNNRQCRQYTHEIFINGQSQVARGTACRNPDGTWTPVS